MRLGRMTLLALALLATSAAAAIAAVSWQAGDYSGTSAGMFKPAGKPLRRAKISFHVAPHRVTGIVVEIRVRCADGSHTSFKTGHDGFLSVDSNGRFAGGAATQTGRDNISGQLSGSSATGYVRTFEKEDANGNEDPKGQLCDSGRLKWTAHLK